MRSFGPNPYKGPVFPADPSPTYSHMDFLDRMRETLAPSKTYGQPLPQMSTPPSMPSIGPDADPNTYLVTLCVNDDEGDNDQVQLSVKAYNKKGAEARARQLLSQMGVQEIELEYESPGDDDDDDTYYASSDDDDDHWSN